MQHLFFIAIGGSIGALSRYTLSRYIGQTANDLFPYGTLLVNVAGSFLIGFFFEIFNRSVISSDLKSLITIGFLGAFTTFSTYTLETVNLFRDNEIKMGVLNIVYNNSLAILFLIIGIYFSKVILKIIR
ncbi:MAG: fluoride efflux transporter CrcB [Spirochaetes bacterium]|nr:fluoride efflux transporter CrcB [Spirochaetota bacterium]